MAGCGLRVTTTSRLGKTSELKSIFWRRAAVSLKPPATTSVRPSSRAGTRPSQVGENSTSRRALRSLAKPSSTS